MKALVMPGAVVCAFVLGFEILRGLPRVGVWALIVAALCLAALIVLLLAAPFVVGLSLLRRQWSQAGGWAIAWGLAFFHYLIWIQTMPT